MSQQINSDEDSPPDQTTNLSDRRWLWTALAHAQKSINRPIGFLILVPILFGLWLMITSMTEVLPELGVYDGKRVLELYLITVTLTFLLLHTQTRRKLENIVRSVPTWVRSLLIIFFGLGLISALRTPNPAYPLLDVAMLFLLLLTTISIASIRQFLGVYFDRVVLICVALMGIGIVLQELMGMMVYLSTEMQFNSRESLLHFSHPRLYNQVQTWTLPLLALLPLVFHKYRRIGLLGVFLIGAQWYIILSTGARGTTVT